MKPHLPRLLVLVITIAVGVATAASPLRLPFDTDLPWTSIALVALPIVGISLFRLRRLF